MAPRNNHPTSRLCSIPSLFIFLCILTFSLFVLFNKPSFTLSSISNLTIQPSTDSLKVFVANLPRSLNYGLLENYWSLPPDSRIPTDPDHESGSSRLPENLVYPPYPENPLIKQYSAEYWMLGDLMTPESLRAGSFARRVFDEREADVVFVPFFATLSAEMQLSVDRAAFKKKAGNEDYKRQREVVDLVKSSDAWKRSGGRDHVFVLTG